jgi:thiamine-monophosphate kinase
LTTTVRTPAETVGTLGERALIARIRERLAPPPAWLLVGPVDDAAIVARERNAYDVITTDACVEGIHFDRGFVPPTAIGHRAVAANLSDLAAMGAQPRLILLSLILPPALSLAEFDDVIEGVLEACGRHRVTVAGGNITRSPGPLIVDITALGTVRPRRQLLRTGARPGDLVFVTGSLGGARAGLQMCEFGAESVGTDSASPKGRYLWPEPRIRTGLQLGRQQAATACMDLSDGLADGVRQLAQASGVGMEIDADALPIDANTRQWFEGRGKDAILEAALGGDDYELLFTAAPRRQGRLRSVQRTTKTVTFTRIGVVTGDKATVLVRGSRRDPMPEGFQHFLGEP